MLGFAMPGGWELAVILVIALIIFGSRLPKVVGDMGKALSEFRKGLKDKA